LEQNEHLDDNNNFQHYKLIVPDDYKYQQDWKANCCVSICTANFAFPYG